MDDLQGMSWTEEMAPLSDHEVRAVLRDMASACPGVIDVASVPLMSRAQMNLIGERCETNSRALMAAWRNRVLDQYYEQNPEAMSPPPGLPPYDPMVEARYASAYRRPTYGRRPVYSRGPR